MSIDIARWGRIISIQINAFTTVYIEDGIVYDGVIHVLSNVLIPPKSVDSVLQHWNGEEMSVDEFKSRLDPLVDNADFDNFEL